MEDSGSVQIRKDGGEQVDVTKDEVENKDPKIKERKKSTPEEALARLEQRKKEQIAKFKGFHSDAVWMPLDSITPYENNPKRHPPEQIDKIARSIVEFNFDQPIVVDSNKVIIKGHGRYLAAIKLGLSEVPVVIRKDLSENEVRASRIADNQTAESYWHIGNLLREMEALYGMDANLESSGFGEDEIKSMYPGLLETEADFALHDSEGTIPADIAMKGVDGLIGQSIPKTGEGEEGLSEWINAHERVVIPFSGDRMGLAALCWSLSAKIDTDKIRVVDTFFGLRNWRWHDEYLYNVSEALDVAILKSEDCSKAWKDMVRERGYPSKSNPWCCNRFRSKSIREQFTEDASKTVVIWGHPIGEEGPVYRQRGHMQDTGVDYADPFYSQSDDALSAIIDSTGVRLNPLYQVTDLYLCPGCPRYSRPDLVFLKNHDLDLWIRWMVYFGHSQINREYLESEEFDRQALDMIGDGIEPREYGYYRHYAEDLPDCPQPDRDHVRVGDDYGWDLEADAKLPEEGKLDRSMGRWWEEEGKTAAFIKSEKETERYHKERGDMPLEDWLRIKIIEAKEAVAAEDDPDGAYTSGSEDTSDGSKDTSDAESETVARSTEDTIPEGADASASGEESSNGVGTSSSSGE